MYTATTKPILDPITEAITALILVNFEAEEKNLSMPDLTDVTEAVAEQAKNLISVGDSMKEYGDSKLQTEIKESCKIISDAYNALLQASKLLKQDPKGKLGRDLLVSGTKGILTGTTKLLNSYDESEVRKVVQNCQEANAALKKLIATSNPNEIKDIVKPVLPRFSIVEKLFR